MTSAHIEAVEAATDLLTRPRYLVEAIVALRRGRALFRPGDFADQVRPTEYLAELIAAAELVEIACRRADLVNLADLCERLHRRLRQAIRADRIDLTALPEVCQIIAAAREALAVADPLSV